MPMNQDQIDQFIKNAMEKKHAKKKTRKQAFEDFRKWKDGKLDKDTTLPKVPTRGRMARAKPKPTT